MLGDNIKKALEAAGLSQERVERWLGYPCGCADRQYKLNAIDSWARRVLSGKLERAAEYLSKITGG